MQDDGRELERVLETHAAALSRLAASYESRPAPLASALPAVESVGLSEPLATILKPAP